MKNAITYEQAGRKIDALRRRWHAGLLSSAAYARKTAAILARPVVSTCGSGWTSDRCTKPLGHSGLHSNE